MINLGGDSSEDDEALEVQDVPAASLGNLVSTILQSVEPDDDVDEPLLDQDAKDIDSISIHLSNKNTAEQDLIISPEFVEASTAIQEDQWDFSSWMIFLEEVEHHRGGLLSYEVASLKFLDHFPRCAAQWLKLGNHFFLKGDERKAEQYLISGARKCWNVELWSFLLKVMVERLKKIQSHNKEAAAVDRTKCEATFELALDQIGLAIDSHEIWKAYIDFVDEWPSIDPLDRHKKLTTLRKIYQRAVCISIDNVEKFWSSYETFERDLGVDIAGDASLGELHKKHLHCKTILRERKEKIKGIIFDRFSSPPTNSTVELQELERWSQWIRSVLLLKFQ